MIQTKMTYKLAYFEPKGFPSKIQLFLSRPPTHVKNMSQLGNLPQVGEKIQHI